MICPQKRGAKSKVEMFEPSPPRIWKKREAVGRSEREGSPLMRRVVNPTSQYELKRKSRRQPDSAQGLWHVHGDFTYK